MATNHSIGVSEVTSIESMKATCSLGGYFLYLVAHTNIESFIAGDTYDIQGNKLFSGVTSYKFSIFGGGKNDTSTAVAPVNTLTTVGDYFTIGDSFILTAKLYSASVIQKIINGTTYPYRNGNYTTNVSANYVHVWTILFINNSDNTQSIPTIGVIEFNHNQSDMFDATEVSITSGSIGFCVIDDADSGYGPYFNFSSLYQTTYDTISLYNESENWLDSDDPYDEGGNTDTGGGTGNHDDTSDPVPIPSLPSLSAADAGFVTIFNPTQSQLLSLASYMWDSSLFDLSTWQKLFANPMDAILSLSIVPVNVPSSNTGVVTVGNISTGITMNKADSQFVSFDCGSITVEEYWGNYLDYSPYTKAELYLPYCGMKEISVDDIMGKTVQIVYHIDILSGACCAYVYVDTSVLYTFLGHCSSQIPVAATDITNIIQGSLTIAGAAVMATATGGASAPMTLGAATAATVNAIKQNVSRSGSVSGSGGLLAIQTPYLVITRPRQALPLSQNSFMGYPSFITSYLSNLSGYTEIESIHLENVPATSDELDEIVRLLKEGVIL